MNPEIIPPLATYLLGLADDELILGHRNSEWSGHAPILEEDIAFTNLALDEIGHAAQWYSVVAQLSGKDSQTYTDELIFQRSSEDFCNAQIVELPNGDWAFSMLRQFLFDMSEKVRLETLAENSYEPLAEVAAKIRVEEMYHRRHTRAWVRRLGLGSEESHRRMQNALSDLWPYALQLFAPLPSEEMLVQSGAVPSGSQLRLNWEEPVILFLQDCGLAVPPVEPIDVPRDRHTPHLKVLIEEMQSVSRSDPGAEW